jgi:RimJ/RimL family protein N-acetyltransferase
MGGTSKVRDAEKVVGSPHFGPTEEEPARIAFRRSLFVARPVAAGAVLTCDDIRCVRPSVGLDPRTLPDVLGRTAARALSAGEPLRWDGVGPPATRHKVTLQPATEADSARLLAWRNDPLTVATSITGRAIEPRAHQRWLADKLASKTSLLLIASDECDAAVGQIRLDATDVRASLVVSLILAPEARGRRLASAVLAAVEEPARGHGALRLLACIRRGNEASERAFKSAGYYQFIEREADGTAVRWCERRLVPFA